MNTINKSNKEIEAERRLLFYATKHEWVNKMIKDSNIDFKMDEICTEKEINDYLNILMASSQDCEDNINNSIKAQDLMDEMLLKIDYLKNYNEMIDIETDKTVDKIKIGHIKSLTYSLEREIDEINLIAEYVWKLINEEVRKNDN